MSATTVYSTATGSKSVYDALPLELKYELGLGTTPAAQAEEQSFEEYYEWCFVCSRPTDHRGEHDDLVEAGKAEYASDSGCVYLIR